MALTGTTHQKRKVSSTMTTNKALQGEPIHEAAISIMRPSMEVYNFWRDLNNLPKFMKHLKSIESRSENISHWRWKALKDQVEVSWDSETIQDVPGSLIAWRTVGDSQVTHEGWVTFTEEAFSRGTTVRIQLAYDPPGGTLTHFIEKLLGESPEAALRDDLRRMRQLLETGELATIEGQPHGGQEPQTNPSIHH